jgi:hypothetical protein
MAARLPSTRAPAVRALATLLIAAAALSLVAAAAGRGARSGGARRVAKPTRTVVVVKSLEQGRQYGAQTTRQKPAFDRLDGTLESKAGKARVAAFREGGALRLLEESIDAGERGSARNLYCVQDGRLVYYESLTIRVRDVGRDLRPARDEVVLALAYDEQGRRVGAEKTVNREAVPLEPAEEAAVLRRFQALAGKAQAAEPAK